MQFYVCTTRFDTLSIAQLGLTLEKGEAHEQWVQTHCFEYKTVEISWMEIKPPMSTVRSFQWMYWDTSKASYVCIMALLHEPGICTTGSSRGQKLHNPIQRIMIHRSQSPESRTESSLEWQSWTISRPVDWLSRTRRFTPVLLSRWIYPIELKFSADPREQS